jgi:hypothetical protein
MCLILKNKSKWILGVAFEAFVSFPHDFCLPSMYMQSTLNQMDMSYMAWNNYHCPHLTDTVILPVIFLKCEVYTNTVGPVHSILGC